MQDLSNYIEHLKQRKLAEKMLNLSRQKEALSVANNISNCLKEKYKVDQVILFGSILSPEYFTQSSDIDIAVNIDSKNYSLALRDINNLAEDFTIDFVDIKDCRESIKKSIFERGLSL